MLHENHKALPLVLSIKKCNTAVEGVKDSCYAQQSVFAAIDAHTGRQLALHANLKREDKTGWDDNSLVVTASVVVWVMDWRRFTEFRVMYPSHQSGRPRFCYHLYFIVIWLRRSTTK